MVQLGVTPELPLERFVPALHVGLHHLEMEGRRLAQAILEGDSTVGDDETWSEATPVLLQDDDSLPEQGFRFNREQGHLLMSPAGDLYRHQEVDRDQIVREGGHAADVRANLSGQLIWIDATPVDEPCRPPCSQAVDRLVGTLRGPASAVERKRNERALEEAVLPQPTQARLYRPKRNAVEQKRLDVIASQVAVAPDRLDHGLIARLDGDPGGWPLAANIAG